jgi:hypothetical protein
MTLLRSEDIIDFDILKKRLEESNSSLHKTKTYHFVCFKYFNLYGNHQNS